MSLLEQAPDWLTRVNIRQSKHFPNPQNAQIVLHYLCELCHLIRAKRVFELT